ncbi:hypothetical protein LTR17_006381 [Elasticomyces elasticus]|nr:hypothetical protein LTR17_006381 [Elasticomyces elasticus]
MDRYDVASDEQERANVVELRTMINTMIDGLNDTDVEVTDSEGEEEPGVPQSTVAGPAKPQVEQEFETSGPVLAIKDTVLAPIEEESSQASERPYRDNASSRAASLSRYVSLSLPYISAQRGRISVWLHHACARDDRHPMGRHRAS